LQKFVLAAAKSLIRSTLLLSDEVEGNRECGRGIRSS